MHLHLHEQVNLIPSFISVFFFLSLLSFLPKGFCVLFSFSFLGQASARSALEATPSLESEASEGVYCLLLLPLPFLVYIFLFSLPILLSCLFF